LAGAAFQAIATTVLFEREKMKKTTDISLLQLCGSEHLLLLSVFGNTTLREAIDRELHNRAISDKLELHRGAQPCLAE